MNMDATLLFLINNGLANPFLDVLMLIITKFGSITFWFLVVIYLFIKKEKKAAITLMIATITNSLLVYALKSFIFIPRPSEVFSNIRVLENPPFGSYPSAHAAQSSLSAMILGKYYPKISILLWILVVLVSFSRVYLGVHYPSDVIVGILEGVVMGFVLLRYLPINRIEKRMKKFWKKCIKVRIRI